MADKILPTEKKVSQFTKAVRLIFPEYRVLFELELTKRKLEDSQREENHLSNQLWEANTIIETAKEGYRALAQEYNQMLEKARQIETQNIDWERAYSLLEQEIQEERIQHQQPQPNNSHHIHTLQTLLELQEILYPSSDDFDFMSAAFQIYHQKDEVIPTDLETAISSSLEKSPRYQQASLNLAQKLTTSNQPQTARSLYLLLCNHPNTTEKIRTIAQKYIQERPPDTTEASALLQDYNALWTLAKYQLSEFKTTANLQHLLESITNATRAIHLNPEEMLQPIRQYLTEEEYTQQITTTAKTLRDQKNISHAQQIYEFLTIIEPNKPHHHYFLATIYEQTNQLDNARIQYQAAGNGSSAKAGLARIEQKISVSPK